MPSCFRSFLRFFLGLCFFFFVLDLSGCSGDRRSFLEKEKAEQEAGIGFLKERQAKFTEKHYPKYGSAWSIDMHGVTLDDAALEKLKGVGYISELNLSKTAMNDARMEILKDKRISGFLLKLDLSHTDVTDAALDAMKDMGLLTEINLTGTKVTKAGVERFKKERAADERLKPMFKNPKINY